MLLDTGSNPRPGKRIEAIAKHMAQGSRNLAIVMVNSDVFKHVRMSPIHRRHRCWMTQQGRRYRVEQHDANVMHLTESLKTLGTNADV